MNGAGVGSTFIVQLPVQAGGKVEPQIMTNRAHSVTFGSDAEVQTPPPFPSPPLPALSHVALYLLGTMM